jgi:hypothetical protein
MRKCQYFDITQELILALIKSVSDVPKSAKIHKIIELDRQPRGPIMLDTFRVFIEDESFGDIPEGGVYPRLDVVFEDKR